MKNYRNYLKSIIIFLLSLIVYLFIITTLAYFNVISYKVVSVTSFIFITLLFMYNGFMMGKISDAKGYLSGLIIGGVNILLVVLLALILRCFPGIKSLIYFLVLMLSSTLGGMFGINFKRK